MLDLFLMFFKIGLFTFGGGYAMISQIKENVVEKKKWLTEEELTEVITIAESTPGPIAINLATYVGYKKNGFWGSLVATLGVVIPSVVILYVLSLFLETFMQNRYVQYAFVGIKCAVAFLILKTGAEMFFKLEKNALSLLLFFAVFSLSLLFDFLAVNFSAVFFILIGGGIGLFLQAVSKCRKGDKK